MSDWVFLAIVCVVLAPLFASPLAVIAGHRTVAFAIAWIASGVSLVSALALLAAVKDGTVLSYAMGGWAPPVGIEYRVDAANALVLVIVSAMAFITLPYSRETIRQEIPTRHHALFYACLMLCLTGLLGVTITGDAFNVFVFLEISSLATYVLVSLGAKRDKRALSAAYDYLLLGTIGATFFVIGVGVGIVGVLYILLGNTYCPLVQPHEVYPGLIKLRLFQCFARVPISKHFLLTQLGGLLLWRFNSAKAAGKELAQLLLLVRQRFSTYYHRCIFVLR